MSFEYTRFDGIANLGCRKRTFEFVDRDEYSHIEMKINMRSTCFIFGTDSKETIHRPETQFVLMAAQGIHQCFSSLRSHRSHHRHRVLPSMNRLRCSRLPEENR